MEGGAGREHTDPQLLISLWLYAYSRGISSARELARQCEYEPGCQWLCGVQPVSHRTLSGFRSDNKAGLDDLFAQVLGMLSAEGLITLERVTLDGTKIKANAGGNTFRRHEKIAAHLAAREQVRVLNAQAAGGATLTRQEGSSGLPLRFWFCKGGTFFSWVVRTLTLPLLSCCTLFSPGFPFSIHPLQQTPAIPQHTNHLK